jgi:hypothetical protein
MSARDMASAPFNEKRIIHIQLDHLLFMPLGLPAIKLLARLVMLNSDIEFTKRRNIAHDRAVDFLGRF